MRFTQTCVVLGVLSLPALASAQIKQPGAHAHYSAELEPHLVVQWDEYAPCANAGFGPGFRATIPFLDNGPIPKINNNMGISFGLDWAHSGISSNCAAIIGTASTTATVTTADIWDDPRGSCSGTSSFCPRSASSARPA
ncbi:MAG: hypothetical protein WDO74_07900 [Pseudomonadota bacterium]